MYHGCPSKAVSGYRSPTRLQEGRKIVTVKDVEPEKFIVAFSQHLKRQGLDLPGLMSEGNNLFLIQESGWNSKRGFYFQEQALPKTNPHINVLQYIHFITNNT